MRWKPHVRFGERAGETDQQKCRHRALARLHDLLAVQGAETKRAARNWPGGCLQDEEGA